MENNILYAQSGGPTAVINSSAYGVFKRALKCDAIDNCYAGCNGIEGILKGDFVKIDGIDKVSLLLQTPGAAFGSCRHNLKDFNEDESEYLKIVDIFKRFNIRYFLYNGGNDSMETVLKLSQYFKKINFPCSVLGIPKTIDNDLMETDHTPGYGSASKFIANTVAEIVCDAKSYFKGRVNIIEIMGRDTGWLTLSSALASKVGYGPDLIYIPEFEFDIENFRKRVNEIYSEKKHCFVAVSEGLKDKDGNFVSALSSTDSFGHSQLGGVSQFLASYLTNCGYKTRGIELSLPQRAAAHFISETDSEEAVKCGSEAVDFLLEGETGKMVSIERKSVDKYSVKFSLADITKVGGKIKYVSEEFYDKEKCFVTDKYFSYASPLIEGECKIKYRDGIVDFFSLENLEK